MIAWIKRASLPRIEVTLAVRSGRRRMAAGRGGSPFLAKNQLAKVAPRGALDLEKPILTAPEPVTGAWGLAPGAKFL